MSAQLLQILYFFPSASYILLFLDKSHIHIFPDNSESSSENGDAGEKGTNSASSEPWPHYDWYVITGPHNAKETLSWTGHNGYSEVNSPAWYDRKFLNTTLSECTVKQSNIYSIQQNPYRPLNQDTAELEQFMSCCVHMPIYGLKRVPQYWTLNMRVERC